MAVSTIDPNGLNIGQIGGTRNLIINGAMQVAQRGTSFGAGDGYKLDRFICVNHTSASQSSSSPSGFQNSLEVTGTNVLVRQPIENSYSRLSTNTFTVSFYIKGNAAYSGAVDINDGTQQSFSVTTSWQRIVKTFDALTSPNAVYGNDNAFLDIQVSDTSATWQITGVQLEVGDTATPFEHRSYGQELALCQRYYQQFGGSDYCRQAAGYITNTSNLNVVKHLLTTMRVLPSLSTSGSFGVYFGTGGSLNIISTINLETAGSDTSVISLNCNATGLTAGSVGLLVAYNDASARLSFDAEL